MNTRFRGFTLIELLVVIAIIGILSAVILASLSTARSKGQDAATQGDMSSIQEEAEIYYGTAGTNSYGTATNVCTGGMFSADNTIANALAQISPALVTTAIVCHSSGTPATQYAVGAKLNAVTGWWCIDSTGTAKQESTTLPTSNFYACP